MVAKLCVYFVEAGKRIKIRGAYYWLCSWRSTLLDTLLNLHSAHEHTHDAGGDTEPFLWPIFCDIRHRKKVGQKLDRSNGHSRHLTIGQKMVKLWTFINVGQMLDKSQKLLSSFNNGHNLDKIWTFPLSKNCKDFGQR